MARDRLALRYAHHPSVADDFSARLDRLEERITWKPRSGMHPVERIYRLGAGLLATKEVEFLGEPQTGSLVDRIQSLQRALVGRIEDAHLGERKEGTIPERVKGLRQKMRKELTDQVEGAPERVERLYDDLDTLFVAIQLYSYPGQYLDEDPSVDRIAETILKLEEDVLGQATYPGPRSVKVRFDTPIDTGSFLELGGFTPKTGVEPLTDLLATRIQAMLEEMG